jgi:hypothetical protein
MIFTVGAHRFSALLDFLSLLPRSEREKDLEIVLLGQPLRILQRNRTRPLRLSWWEKVPLAILASKFVQGGSARIRATIAHSGMKPLEKRLEKTVEEAGDLRGKRLKNRLRLLNAPFSLLNQAKSRNRCPL